MKELIEAIDAFEKKESLVKVFGAIIYSNRHPHIKKVLRDEDYWLDFNDSSGSRWVIFAARALEGRTEIRGGGRPGSLSMMYQVWVEPDKNKKFLEYLGLQSTEKPVFVVFTRLKNGQILKSALPLDDSSIQKAQERLKQVISDLTSAIEKIDEENIEDYESVFGAVDMSVQHIRDMNFLRNLYGIWQWGMKVKL